MVALVTMVVLVTMVIEGSTSSVPGWKAIYSHLHNYTERLFCIALLIRSFDIVMAEM